MNGLSNRSNRNKIPFQFRLKKNLIVLFLFLLIGCSNVLKTPENLNTVARLELIIGPLKGDDKKSLVLELTNEASDSCYSSNSKIARVLLGSDASYSQDKYSYWIEGEELHVELFPGMCDAESVLVGKINSGKIIGKRYHLGYNGSSITGYFIGSIYYHHK